MVSFPHLRKELLDPGPHELERIVRDTASQVLMDRFCGRQPNEEIVYELAENALLFATSNLVDGGTPILPAS